MKNKLAIFDLDGTLFDTNEVNYRAYQKALEENGFSLEKSFFFKECNGKHYTQFLPMVGVKDPSAIQFVHERKKELYSMMLHHASENRQLFDIADGLRAAYYLGLVTTASKMNTMDILHYFHREDFFDLVITQDDIVKTKPDPEGFHTAMKYFKVLQQNTVIFEDSEVGILAAENSGASVYCVKNFCKGEK